MTTRGVVLRPRQSKAGAKYPEVAAAQWALESGWGAHTSGDNNYFGIKAADNEPYSTCTTWEHYDGKDVTIQAKFRDFDSLQECIDDLVTKWYLDYKGYKGVNRAQSVGECCQLLDCKRATQRGGPSLRGKADEHYQSTGIKIPLPKEGRCSKEILFPTKRKDELLYHSASNASTRVIRSATAFSQKDSVDWRRR